MLQRLLDRESPDSADSYLHEIGNLPLLTARDERYLGDLIKHGTPEQLRQGNPGSRQATRFNSIHRWVHIILVRNPH